MSGSNAFRGLSAPRADRAKHWLVRQAGRALPGGTLLPEFLVVGGKRCGSTTLHDAIISHPQVLPPLAAKSSHYFDVNHDRGFDWYRSHFPTESAGRRLERRINKRVITGESSPYYSFHPLAPARIADELPDATLIFCLRDPVERAWSNYRYSVERGHETLSFTDALDAEPARLQGQEKLVASGGRSLSHRQHTYLARGRYIEHLRKLEEFVDRSKLVVVIAEELFERPDEVMSEIWSRLGLAPYSASGLGHFKAAAQSAMAAEERQRLVEYFEPYNQELDEWLGRSPRWQRACAP